MRRQELVVSKQNNVDVIRYDLAAADVYDEKVFDKASAVGNILKYQYSDKDGKRSITNFADMGVTLDVFIKDVLNKKQVCCIFSGLISAFEIGTQGIPVVNLVREPEYIYVDRESLAVKFAIIPLKQNALALQEIPSFFKKIIIDMKFAEEGGDDYVAKIITILNAPDFSISSLRKFIDSELHGLNVKYDKVNGLPASPKVSRVGVMNNNMPPQGMPGMMPQGVPVPPQAPKPQGMPGMVPPQGAPVPPQAPKPQGMPGMMPPQGAPVPPQAPKPQGMPGMMPPQGAPVPPQGTPVPPQAPKPQGMPGMMPQGAPVPPQAPKPQGMPGMMPPQGAPVPPQGAPVPPQAPKPQGMPGMMPPQGAPVPPQAPKPQGMPGMMPPQGAPGMMPPQVAPVPPQAPKPQGMPGMMPQGAPVPPQAPKPQGMPGMMPPQGAPGMMPQGTPVPPQAPKPQGMPGMMPPQGAPISPQGAPVPPQAPKPQGMPGMMPQGAPIPPQAPKPQGAPGMMPPQGAPVPPQAPKPHGAPGMMPPHGAPVPPQAPKPQGMPGMMPQGAPVPPQEPKPQGMPGMMPPQGVPVPPQEPKPQEGAATKKEEIKQSDESVNEESPKPVVADTNHADEAGEKKPEAVQGAPVPPQAPKPQGMPGMMPQGAPVPPQAPKPQGAPIPPQGVIQGSIMGQLGTKPVPHIVRKKTGETINITKPEFHIGKSKTKADYAIGNNSAISRDHCIIVQKDGVNYIKDNNSTNHTYVNGVELEPNKEVLLKNKSIIQLGDEEFIFLLRSE